jgi:hypothetical protein
VLKTKEDEFIDDDSDDEDGAGEDEEEEDDKTQQLEDLMDELDEEEREGEDEPLDKLDPLHSISASKLIEEWVRGTAQDAQQAFISYAQQLPADLQQVTQSILHPPPVK